MCGIAGAYQGNSHQTVNEMVMQLKHRGPDGDGVMPTDDATLGHTRLAIVDVAGGHQPLQNGRPGLRSTGKSTTTWICVAAV